MSNNPTSQMNELENEHAAVALQEVEERKRAGFPVTCEWLDANEREHMALALQEIAGQFREEQ